MKGFLLTLFLGMSLLGMAQTFTIEGTVVDSVSKRNLASATISIVKAKDSSLVSFARSNELGFFSVKSVPVGSYLISISYVGFIQQWIAFKTGKNAKIDLANIYMLDASSLSTVTVTARRPPVVINGDSIEFNAENFKTAPNAVVEDLLKKMPGIEVDKSGAITVNGKTVTKVFVNGKEFFTGDPKMATRNLPADAIDKIQVYDRKSDQSMFTGIDDGSEETAINLKVKKDRNQSNFGKLTGGGGVPERFDLRGNLNRINNDEQFSIIGSGNNINRQDFSARDFSSFSGGGGGGRPGGGGGGVSISFGGGGGGGGGGEGVATTISGGGNYSNVFNDKRTDFNANLSLSDIDRLNTSHSYTQNLTPGNIFNRYDSSKSTSVSKQQSIGSTLDHKVSESFSYKLTPSIGISNGTSESWSSSETLLPDGTRTNSNKTHASSATDATNFNNTLLLKKKFAKKGRTISSTITNGYNTSNSNGLQFTDQFIYASGKLVKDSILDQRNLRKGNTTTYSANVIYTEPLGKRSLLEMNAYLSQSIGSSSKKVYDKTANDNTGVLNTRLTNEFNSEYTYSGGGMNYRTNQRKFNFASGFAIQNAKLNGENISAKTKLNQDFKDILPSAMFRYNFSQTKNLNIDYRTSTNQPSITQLQPVLDQSNINRQTIGNPDLKRSYQHNINIRFFSSKVISVPSINSWSPAGATDPSAKLTEPPTSNAEISTLVPNEKMYFTHIGNIKNFEEQPLDETTKAWSGAQENYEIIKNGSLSKVIVTLDIVDEYANFFLESFPKGLATIKEIADFETEELEITTNNSFNCICFSFEITNDVNESVFVFEAIGKLKKDFFVVSGFEYMAYGTSFLLLASLILMKSTLVSASEITCGDNKTNCKPVFCTFLISPILASWPNKICIKKRHITLIILFI